MGSPTFGKVRQVVGGLSVVLLLAAGSPGAAQQTVEQFYKGKTVSLLIGHPPGGSYDLYARLAIAHMGKYIPGNPTIQLQSRPGSGEACPPSPGFMPMRRKTDR